MRIHFIIFTSIITGKNIFGMMHFYKKITAIDHKLQIQASEKKLLGFWYLKMEILSFILFLHSGIAMLIIFSLCRKFSLHIILCVVVMLFCYWTLLGSLFFPPFFDIPCFWHVLVLLNHFFLHFFIISNFSFISFFSRKHEDFKFAEI